MKISFECSEQIAELKKDIAEFGAKSNGFAIYQKRKAKIPFSDKYVDVDLLVNYLPCADTQELKPGELQPGEIAIIMPLEEILTVFEEENKII